MPFYIRRSISAGPFRFNLSKSGIGLSVGIRGLRLGTGPCGHYVHAGRGGLYYRSSIGRAGGRRRSGGPPGGVQPALAHNALHHPTVDLVEVESGGVLEMADSRFQTVLDDLNGRAAQFRMIWAGAGVGFMAWAIGGFGGAGLLVGLLFVGLGAYADSYRRASVVFYDLEGSAHDAYLELVAAFNGLARCSGKWHVAAGGAVRDLGTWKRNAGAAQLVKKSPTLLEFRLPGVMRSNVNAPAIAVGKQWLHFMPDAVLVAHDGRFGAIPYEELTVAHQPSRFIEDGAVPIDAGVVDHTWRFVNKSGGPDRRFSANRQLPICLYEVLHLTSPSGLDELLEFSRTDVGAPFSAAVEDLAHALRAAEGKGPDRRAAARLAGPGAAAPGEDEMTMNEARAPRPLAPLLWQECRYGMTPGEVRAAQPGVGVPADDSRLGEGTRVELELAGHEAAGARCNVLFYFRAGALVQVTLSFGADAERRTARDLVIAMTAKYGSPLSLEDPGEGDLIPKMEADWLLPGGVNLALVWMRGIALNANYQYREEEGAGL